MNLIGALENWWKLVSVWTCAPTLKGAILKVQENRGRDGNTQSFHSQRQEARQIQGPQADTRLPPLLSLYLSNPQELILIRYLSRGEIAQRLGVGLATVKQYRNFPPPDAMIGRNQGWLPETIDAWRKSRPKARTGNI